MDTTKKKLEELLEALKNGDDDNNSGKTLFKILAVIAGAAVVCLIAILVYRHFKPDYQDDFEDDLDDDFDDFFEEEDDEDTEK